MKNDSAIHDFLVKDLSLRINQSTKRVEELLEMGLTPEEIIESAKLASDELAKQPLQPSKVSDLIPERMTEKELEKIAPKTGYKKLDELIKGFVPGHLYLLSAFTNVGKTALCCNFAFNVAKQGKRVLYIALEPDNAVIDYLGSIASNKRYDDVAEEDYKKIPDGIDIFKKDKVRIQSDLVKVIRERERYDLVIIDHFGYFNQSQQNKANEESNNVKQLISLAKEKKCAMLVIQHFNKAGGDKKKNKLPSMNQIGGSGALYQDSTEVLIVVRDENDNDQFRLTYTSIGHILVMKTKSGNSGSVRVRFFDGGASINEEEEKWSPQF